MRHQVVGAVIVDGHRVMAFQRAPHKKYSPLEWEFPGGQVEEGEDLVHALIREIREELGVEIQVKAWITQCQTPKITLDLFAAHIVKGQMVLRDHLQYQWVSPQHWQVLKWSKADRLALDAIEQFLKNHI